MELLAGSWVGSSSPKSHESAEREPWFAGWPKCIGFGWIEVSEPASILHGSINPWVR